MPNAMWRQGIGEEGEENQKRENSIVRKGKAILGREEHENTGRLVLELRFALVSPNVVLIQVIIKLRSPFPGALWIWILILKKIRNTARLEGWDFHCECFGFFFF